MENTQSSPLLPKFRFNNRTCRRKLFELRKYLEKHSSLKNFFSLLPGVFIVLHPLTGFLLVNDSVKPLLVTLILLSVEVVVLCVGMVTVICSDLIQNQDQMAVWHRQAFGRLVRNIVVWGVVLASLVLWFINTGPEGTSNLLIVTLPLGVLLVVAFIKFIFIETLHTAYWSISALLGLIQIGLLVAKVDYGVEMSWEAIPTILLGLESTVLIFYELLNSLGNYRKLGSHVFLGVGVICATTVLVVSGFRGVCSKTVLSYASSAGLSLGLVMPLSNWFLDIVFGHLEEDFKFAQKPVLNKRKPRKNQRVQETTFSVKSN